MGKRTLTPDEKKLWKLVNKETKPLRRAHEEEAEEPPAEKPKAAPAKKMKPIVERRDVVHVPRQAPLALGRLDALDGNNADRFRKGEYPIDATLDLHGMTYNKAHGALLKFMERQYTRQSRCLLIITGKGKDGEGILKQSLPGWLAASELRPMILAITPAKAKHGGSGAYYVLLKRKR